MTSFPTKILVATDGSEDADLAARAATDLSNRTGAELHVVHARQDVRLAGVPPATTQDEYTRALERWEHESSHGASSPSGGESSWVSRSHAFAAAIASRVDCPRTSVAG
jgi:nucleotide-binding universal stress UspA family protein